MPDMSAFRRPALGAVLGALLVGAPVAGCTVGEVLGIEDVPEVPGVVVVAPTADPPAGVDRLDGAASRSGGREDLVEELEDGEAPGEQDTDEQDTDGQGSGGQGSGEQGSGDDGTGPDGTEPPARDHTTPTPVPSPSGSTASGSTTSGSTASPEPGGLTQEVELLLLSMANGARAEAGLPGLEPHEGLTEVARTWSVTLAASGAPLAHNPHYAEQVPGGWRAVAENVAWTTAPARSGAQAVAEQIHRGWMDSPGHRANILNPDLTHLGVGVGHDDRHGFYLTQVFARYPSR